MKKLIRFFGQYRLFSIALATLIIGLILYFSGFHSAAQWLISIVAIGEVLPSLWRMYEDFRSGKYGVDILAATAIIVSIILGQYWAGIVVVLMLTGGQSLEDYASKRAQRELHALLKSAPQSANVITKKKIESVPIDDIKVGDKFLVKAGEVVAVDGVIIDGQANFNEASITGEGLPQSKDKGDRVISGSISIDGVVTVKATAIAADSQYQQIIKLVRTAANSQAPFVRLADHYALPFTIAAYAIGLSVWVLSGDAIRFLEVIIVATPCPLILGAPTALISGMSRASHYGIIIKTATSLEKLAQATVMAFDKTGTLTKGELSVKSIVTFNKFSESEVLRFALTLEQNSNHVLAEAIVAEAKSRQIKGLKAKHLEEISGLGVKANIKGDEVVVGSYVLMMKEGINIPDSYKHGSIKETSAFVSINGHLAGIVTFEDEIRPEAAATLAYLHANGIKEIAMITGDNKVTAEFIAEKLGIDKVFADALPADKLHFLSTLKPKPIVFVGDGVNDAPVLTAADVGIAMGAKGSTAASESADMVVMPNDISRVATGVGIAKRTFQIARQSVLIGIGLSLILMFIFATGKFTPLMGAIIQEVVDVFVIFNALRAHMIEPLVINKNEGHE
ncbi:MAG TPA: heavy metal translocating P-type ATPase [Candidatus Sulfotelmatobacter sp.]|nr:heavy metal translocating P-type ATPase [Candidatus Sulfotelmatobacter sp.]